MKERGNVKLRKRIEARRGLWTTGGMGGWGASMN